MSNAEERKANLIFDKWKADLKEMDRSKPAVEGNFDLLFSNFKKSKISFDIAHGILSKAIVAHYPSQSVADNVYKRLKILGTPKQEFIDDWKENIDATAKRVFYSLYDIDGDAANDEDEDGEPKVYGSMSVVEYRKQRKHAEAFPVLDWTKIKLEDMFPEDMEEIQNMIKTLENKDE